MENRKKKCIACKELIAPDASICPHCHSQQKKLTNKKLLEGLKQLSAITVVFSLIFGVIELNRFVDSWLENSTYAERLSKSADLAINAGDLTGAWALLTEAKQVHPASKEVSALQLKLAMMSVRGNINLNDPKDIKKLTESIYALYRGLGASNKSDADVLAHIAWGSYRLRNNGYGSVHIDQFLNKALEKNNNSMYANTLKGYWYLVMSENYRPPLNLPDIEKVSLAQKHFKKALGTGIDTNYVRSKQLAALHSGRNIYAAAEFMKIVLNLKTQDNEYLKRNEKRLLGNIVSLYYNAISQDASSKSENLETVFLSLSTEKQKTLISWLKSNDDYIKQAMLHEARLNEKKGNYSQALDRYIDVYKLVKTTALSLRYVVPKLIKRICSKPENLKSNEQSKCDEFNHQILDPRHLRD